MFEKKYIPKLYKEMVDRKYFDESSDEYIWMYECEWLSEEDVYEYEYEDSESRDVLPFALTGHGDKWGFVNNGSDEPYIGICYAEDTQGTYYAKNFEDAIIRNIIEFVSSSYFYIDEDEAESYEISGEELEEYLEQWINAFKGILKQDYIDLLNALKGMKLKKCSDDYCEWYALLTVEEARDLVRQYCGFELLDKEFEWYELTQ